MKLFLLLEDVVWFVCDFIVWLSFEFMVVVDFVGEGVCFMGFVICFFFGFVLYVIVFCCVEFGWFEVVCKLGGMLLDVFIG